MYTLFISLIVLVSLLLILVIMTQNPKGGGLSSSFGGGSSQIVGGVKKTGDFLEKSTWTLAIILAGLILFSNSIIRTTASEQDTIETINLNEANDNLEEVPQVDPSDVLNPDDLSNPNTTEESQKSNDE